MKKNITIEIEHDFEDKNSLFSFCLGRLKTIISSTESVSGNLKPLGNTKVISLFNIIPYTNKKLGAKYSIGDIKKFIKLYQEDGNEFEKLAGSNLNGGDTYLLDDVEKLIAFIKNRK